MQEKQVHQMEKVLEQRILAEAQERTWRKDLMDLQKEPWQHLEAALAFLPLAAALHIEVEGQEAALAFLPLAVRSWKALGVAFLPLACPFPL